MVGASVGDRVGDADGGGVVGEGMGGGRGALEGIIVSGTGLGVVGVGWTTTTAVGEGVGGLTGTTMETGDGLGANVGRGIGDDDGVSAGCSEGASVPEVGVGLGVEGGDGRVGVMLVGVVVGDPSPPSMVGT